ncbi:S1C family serine protease [Blautia sp. MSJ-19]|uniref:S1C family serine protease n=1 Tax=Blautia sp. MSJ-19 TaxID=2841517 RepID=UPI001C0F2C6A|nr:S1C family serine protease [Blautia sp. MSJ-19]MBU5481617.1 S1C family serine protease [Blautia sp. MSJ-19]
MTKRNDGKTSSENYPFIKETIKERPTDRKLLIRKFLTAAACGVIFGGCAAGTITVFLPGTIRSLWDSSEQHTDVTLAPSVTAMADEDHTKEKSVTETVPEVNGTTTENSLDESTETWSDQVREAAKVPRKALVRIAALGTDSGLLDDSFLKYGEEEGFVFLKNADAFYIMTYSDKMNEAGTFQVTFSNGDMADAQLCKKDIRTGFYVFRVPFTEVKSSTQNDIPEAALVAEDDTEQMDPVIAVGSPTGDYDSLVSGTITSTTGSMKIADEEYGMLTTDMVGSDEGGGLLLNMEGEVIGIICNQESDNSSVIRAVEVAQLRPLLEGMANGADICYIGIQGATISKYQSENLNIPRGVYVDSVEEESPAMTAGVQSADIVHALNGEEITSMNEYSAVLQNQIVGSRVKLEVYRKNPYGTYVNVELNIVIKEK